MSIFITVLIDFLFPLRRYVNLLTFAYLSAKNRFLYSKGTNKGSERIFTGKNGQKVYIYCVYIQYIVNICISVGLSYGYPTDMLRISFGKGSITTRIRLENGSKTARKRLEYDSKTHRRWIENGWKMGRKTCCSIGVLSREYRSFVVVDSETMELQNKQNEYFFRQQLPKIIKNFLKPKTRRYALFKNQGKDCSLP